ncbi:MAG: fibronectin type III domain-containing protein, partial [Anaerolineae bacterium]
MKRAGKRERMPRRARGVGTQKSARLLWVLGILVVLVPVGVVLAQVSAGFDLSWHTLSGGGGGRTSANYRIDDTIGPEAMGPSSSANFRVDSGFWYGVSGAASTGPSFGDAYEVDDTCDRAKIISTSGAPQAHTFHDEGDQDWIKFETEVGKTYVIETANVGADHDAVLFLHDACGAPDLGTEDNAFGQTVRLEWNSTSAGTYYLKLQQHDPADHGDQTYYEISIKVDNTPPSPPTSPRSAPADRALVVQWKRPPEYDVNGYDICWNPDASTNGGNICAGVADVVGGDTTYYELSPLDNGTRYYLTIRAVDFSNNESLWTSEISNIPAEPPDATDPSVAVKQPTAAGVYTTTLNTATLSGDAQDVGENLSRVKVHNLTNNSEGWDYTLAGSTDTFYVGSLTLSPGDNTLEVTAYDDADNTGTDTVVLRRLTESTGAVIIVAGHNGTYSLQTNIYNATNNAYRVFQGAGFGDEAIHYLAPVAQDPDGDGTSEVDGAATNANLQAAIETWAASGGRVGPGKPLHIYLMDHGLKEGFCTDGCDDTQQTTPKALDGWLSNLETSTGADTINVIIEACHSGSFIDTLQDVESTISKAGRVVIASTGRNNNAYASAQGAYFSDAFFSCVVDSNDLKTCYNQAKTAVTMAGHNQTPWMDDNGDGLSNPSDGTIASSRYIAAAFGSFRPEIQSASVNVVDTSGTLTAQVERGAEELKLVWAAVYPPSFQEPTDTTLDLGVPVVRLEADPDTEGLYKATYPAGFGEEGAYRVIFYAEDRSGINAQPRLVPVGERSVYIPVV